MRSNLRDIMVVLDSYPTPTNKSVIESAVALAKKLNAHISALSFEIDFKVKTSSITHVLGLDRSVLEILAAEKKKSLSNAKELLHAFETAARKAGVHSDTILETATQFEVSNVAIEHARLRDFTIVATNDKDLADASAEDLLFESGRPILIPPRDLKDGAALSLDNIAIAWDSSRAATRAVSDALPLLQCAKQVRVFTVLNKEDLPADRLGAELKAHLGRHEIEAKMENIDTRGKAIGETLRAYVEKNDIGLLVMGGYGHSRVKEFVLGGATKSVLGQTFQWTFLSH
jgi:nucleotide-binding universal stress UspA family protein